MSTILLQRACCCTRPQPTLEAMTCRIDSWQSPRRGINVKQWFESPSFIGTKRLHHLQTAEYHQMQQHGEVDPLYIRECMMSDDNGVRIDGDEDGIRAFPEPEDVFASQLDRHSEFLLPARSLRPGAAAQTGLDTGCSTTSAS